MTFTACGGGDGDDAPATDAPSGGGDASIDAPPQSTTCPPGTDRLVLAGAVTLDTPSVGYLTVDDKVAGFVGANAGKGFTFTVRNVIAGDVDALGDHDVAATNMKHLEFPPNTDCDTAPAGTCTGFFALSGTFTVTAVSPRYQASFTLGDLRERHDTSDQAGAAMPGTITGCVDINAP